MKHHIIIIAVAICLAAAGCRSHKGTAVSETYDPQVPSAAVATPSVPAGTTPAPQSGNTTGESRNAVEWTDLQIPVKVKLTSPMSLSASGRVTMVRDDVINISLRVLGLEVAVAYIDGDSLMLLDKYDGLAFATPSTPIERLGLTVGSLQDALLGIQPYTDMPLEAFQLDYPASDASMTISYGRPVMVGKMVMASETRISATLGTRRLEMILSWDTGKAKFDTGATVPMPDLRRNRRLSLDDLFRLLSSH